MYFHVNHLCEPTGSLNLSRPLGFIELFCESFSVTQLFINDEPVQISQKWLQKEVNNYLKCRERPDVGVEIGCETQDRDYKHMTLFIRFGTDPGCLATPCEIFTASFLKKDFIREQNFQEKIKSFMIAGIELLNPYYSDIEDAENEDRMNAYQRSLICDPKTRPDIFDEPVLMRWFTYLRNDVTAAFGGKDYVLKCPSQAIYNLDAGVLIHLVTSPFDDEKTEHRTAQLQAMKYLKIPSNLPGGDQ